MQFKTDLWVFPSHTNAVNVGHNLIKHVIQHVIGHVGPMKLNQPLFGFQLLLHESKTHILVVATIILRSLFDGSSSGLPAGERPACRYDLEWPCMQRGSTDGDVVLMICAQQG